VSQSEAIGSNRWFGIFSFYSKLHSQLNTANHPMIEAINRSMLICRAQACSLAPLITPTQIETRNKIAEIGVSTRPVDQRVLWRGPFPNHCIGYDPRKRMNEQAVAMLAITLSFVGKFIISLCRTLGVTCGCTEEQTVG